MSSVLALDIGGANLKAAHSNGTATAVPFEVWRRPKELAVAIAELVRTMPPHELIAVTMTAELCDCFETKADGVNAVLDAVETAARKMRRRTPIRVWLTSGLLVTPAEARADPLKAAAANWLALATWAGRLCPTGPALVVDIGSTTSDVIPLRDGSPVPQGRTDMDRLAVGELVYSGVHRTPVIALVQSLRLGQRKYRLAAELFATTGDVYRWLGELAVEPDNQDTADGRPATRNHAACRLARVICADRTMLSDDELTQIARQIADAQRNSLVRALAQVEMGLGERASSVVTAGSGEFLAQQVIGRLHKPPRIVSIANQLGSAISSVACAHALTVLAAERGAGGK